MSTLSRSELDQLQHKGFYKMSQHMSSLAVPCPLDESEDIITEFSLIPERDVGMSSVFSNII